MIAAARKEVQTKPFGGPAADNLKEKKGPRAELSENAINEFCRESLSN